MAMPPRTNWKKFIGIAAYSMLLVAVVAMAAAFGWLRSTPAGKAVSDHIFTFNPKPPSKVFLEDGKPSDHLTVLVLGCDEDLTTGGNRVTNARARSDMMLVARLDFANKQITALSIPRDLEFRLRTYDNKVHKMNAFHVYGGDDLTKEAVEHLLGLKVDRVSTLDFNAFQDIVDLVGGVTVDVEKPMRYTDRAAKLYIDLKPGVQKLGGYKAMGFVRFRHNDSDFARQERQKQFMLAMKEQLVSHWTALPQVLDKAVALTGDAFNYDEFASLLLFSKSVGQDNIRMGMVPVVEKDRAVKLDEEKLADTLVAFDFIPGKKPLTSETSLRRRDPKGSARA